MNLCGMCGHEVRNGGQLRCPHKVIGTGCPTSTTPSSTSSRDSSTESVTPPTTDPGGVSYVNRSVASKQQRDAFYRRLNELGTD